MKLLDFFPLPKFLEIPVCGFDISDESIKFLEFEKEKNKLKIREFGEKKLPQGYIQGGEIKNEREFSDFLKLNFKDFSTRNLIVSLPEEKAFLDIVELPKMNFGNIKTVLTTQFENYFPLKEKEAIFDYDVLNLKSSDFLNTIVAAYPRRIIDSYKNTLALAGFSPLVFELEAESLKRCLIKQDDMDFKMLIDFGKTRIGFVIVGDGKILFTSTAKIGGEDIDKAIARSLGVDIEKAEKIKKEKGKIYTDTDFYKNSEKNADYELQSVFIPLISSIYGEAAKYIEYFNTHFTHIHEKNANSYIKEIILSGGDANLEGLADYLNKNLKIPVRRGNVWENVLSLDEYIPDKIEFNESLKYAAAVGLALRGNTI